MALAAVEAAKRLRVRLAQRGHGGARDSLGQVPCERVLEVGCLRAAERARVCGRHVREDAVGCRGILHLEVLAHGVPREARSELAALLLHPDSREASLVSAGHEVDGCQRLAHDRARRNVVRQGVLRLIRHLRVGRSRLGGRRGGLQGLRGDEDRVTPCSV